MKQISTLFWTGLIALVIAAGTTSAKAADLKVGDKAPTFALMTQQGEKFDLQSRQGKWTVLYFYPKAETPGCTTQACAFRDSLDKIRALQADVYGVSINTVDEQKAFTKNHQLNFTLLADADGKVTESFGVKMPIVKMAKRWTFIINPDLKIASINKDVDPVKDAADVAATLQKLQSAK